MQIVMKTYTTLAIKAAMFFILSAPVAYVGVTLRNVTAQFWKEYALPSGDPSVRPDLLVKYQ